MSMRIVKVDCYTLDIPFDAGARQDRFLGPNAWNKLTTLLVRVETDTGLVGWGKAFAYSCADAVRAAVETMVAPAIIGMDATDIAGINRHCQQSLHLFGRYGITMFAISGVDIALWDIAAKRARMPLYQLLGGAWRDSIPAYSSLFRYGEADLVAEKCKQSVEDGYAAVKLHEVTEECVAAAREALGPGVPLMVDTNCPWTPEEAREMALRFKPYDLKWLEEPIFPPDDHVALAQLRAETGVPLAAGENHCTAIQFRDMANAHAVDYLQPSVTKVGGITELRKVATVAETTGTTLMPHSPYFGPGWLATLHLMAALPQSGWIERFYMTVEASTSGDFITMRDGGFVIPQEPGLGLDPEPDVIKEYARG